MYKIYYHYNEKIDEAYDKEFGTLEEAYDRALYLVGIKPRFDQILIMFFREDGRSFIEEVFTIDLDNEE